MGKSKTLKKGHNSAMKGPTEKKKKHKSSYFSYLFHISNFKILSLTVLDRMQSAMHQAHTDGRTGPNKYASTSSKLGA